MATTAERMTGTRKAAVLVVALGQEQSAQVLKHLSRDLIEVISREIVRVGNVDPDSRKSVLNEFKHTLQARDFVMQGGFDYAREVLLEAVGEEEAEAILSKVATSLEERPFYSIRKVDPTQLAQLLQNEQPQTIALIVGHLEPSRAAVVLSSLPSEIQGAVAQRLATMESTTPEVVNDIETFLQARVSSLDEEDYQEVGGAQALVDILNHSDRSTERAILETLGEQDPELADQVKDMMFIFEDLINLGAREIQMVLKEIRQEDLLLALKGAKGPLRNSIYENMSSRAAQRLKEDIEISPPARVRDVEAAQQRIVSVVRDLEEKGEITVREVGEDLLIE